MSKQKFSNLAPGTHVVVRPLNRRLTEGTPLRLWHEDSEFAYAWRWSEAKGKWFAIKVPLNVWKNLVGETT